MSAEHTQKLYRRRVGEMPLLQTVVQRLGIEAMLRHYIRPHGNEKIPAAESLLLLIYNIASGRQPLYELPQWTTQFDGRLFGRRSQLSGALFNDDRYGRALDKLYAVDRASLMTDIVLRLVEVTELDLSQIHNDSTSVKTTGQMLGTTVNGLRFARGHSKDHRPDLKQIVFSLTLSNDGAVPIHFKTYPGNRTDDTTHIETWRTIRQIAGRAEFLYVADCKVCTDRQLSYIVRHGGRVVTLLPETWREVKAFKADVRDGAKPKRRILRQLIPNTQNKYETFYRFSGDYCTGNAGYAIHWIYTSEKRKRDRLQREECLLRVERELGELMGKMNMRQLKTAEQITERVEKLLAQHHVADFYHIAINSVQEKHTRQVSKGRPGKHTRYATTFNTIYTLAWSQSASTGTRESG